MKNSTQEPTQRPIEFCPSIFETRDSMKEQITTLESAIETIDFYLQELPFTLDTKAAKEAREQIAEWNKDTKELKKRLGAIERFITDYNLYPRT